LRQTGLYADWESATVDGGMRAYAPGYEAWSDGAAKSRWIYLPPGARIDVSDPNAWVFPTGTKLWKEFRLVIDGVEKKIETRMLWKDTADHWTLATYVWSNDQRSATLATQPVRPFPGPTDYEVPVGECERCHATTEKPLGFSAVMLASPRATGLTFDALATAQLIRSSSPLPRGAALQALPTATPVERQAIGYLHANCGVSCHSPTGEAPYSLRLEVDASGTAPQSIEATSAFGTINHLSRFVPPDAIGLYYRIRPGDSSRSTIAYRMGVRDQSAQMPPIATHEIDQDGVAAVQAWIDSMTSPPYPSPAPVE
jgi:hypothetical protein